MFQDCPRWPQEGPKTVQEGPKRALRGPQDGSRGPQDGPRVPQDSPRGPQERPRGSQDGPRGFQDGLGYPQVPHDEPKSGPRRPKRAPRAAKRIHPHCIISVIICTITLCGTHPTQIGGVSVQKPMGFATLPEAQIPGKLRHIRAPEATISRNSYGLLIVSHPCTTFPCCFKAAPRHPNPALIYPILLERGPAAGGEALTDTI